MYHMVGSAAFSRYRDLILSMIHPITLYFAPEPTQKITIIYKYRLEQKITLLLFFVNNL
jgi:hypothetical protein